VSDELRRIHRFEREIELAGPEEIPSPLGYAVLSDELPLRHDSNFLFVDQDVSTDDAVTEVDRIMGGGGRDFRVILTFDGAIGERLRSDFGARGWRTMRHVFMLQRRRPDKTADVSVVKEVDESALRPGRRREILAQPWGSPDLAEQLLDSKVVLGRRAQTRFFGVEVSGEIVAWTDLYVAQAVAQIEDVATVQDYRERGYASALVLHAADEGRRAGADLVFLVADDEDWPKQLYRRLGFDEVGRLYKFVTP
jgi:ribosomal protein S18 acetylase RimI-like enzyme